MIDHFVADLPHGIRLSCRAAGPAGAPVLLFLHGFPEAAFVWDDVLRHFAVRGYRAVAPNLRGYADSSAPPDVESYRARHLIGDLVALIAQLVPKADATGIGPSNVSAGQLAAGSAAGCSRRVAALVAHDWGGAVAWGLAAARPELLERLVIVNSPHPATFLRELQSNPRQQAASAYMNFLSRPDAATLLAADDHARMWTFFHGLGGDHDGAGDRAVWLDDATRARYLAVWRQGLEGPLNYYRASPLRPPERGQSAADAPVMKVVLPAEVTRVRVPTHVLWGMRDTALPPLLLDGLEAYVPDLVVTRVDDATHWIVHEQPQRVCAAIEQSLQQPPRPA